MNNEESMSEHSATATSRRGLFRLGGLTMATAVVAACSVAEDNKIGTAGSAPANPTLPDPVYDDGIILRTLAGIELSISNAYGRMIDEALLAGPSGTFPQLGDTTEMVGVFKQHHDAAAKQFNKLAKAAGADAWECGNTRLDSAYLFPIFDRVLDGAPATDNAKAIEPSDDPVRDFANLVQALETLSAESCQAFVGQATTPALRVAAMQVGIRSARQSAAYSLLLNPGAFVSPTDAANAQVSAATDTTAAADSTVAPTTAAAASGDAPPQTEIPLPIAVPTQFGSLAPITYVGGRGDENGVRLKLNLETPSLNSFAYAWEECAKG